MSDEAEPQIVSASQEIAAPATRIFELIADPARQPEWDGNDNLAEAATGQRIRAVGDVFLMTLSNFIGSPVRENHVVEFEEGRLIAWNPSEQNSPPPGHLWRWELEPLGDNRTRVTHSYDWTRLSDPNRFSRARATTSEKLAASIGLLAALAEREADLPAASADQPEQVQPGDYAVTNPATNRVERRYDTATDEQAMDAVRGAHRAFARWRSVPIDDRAGYLTAVAAEYRADRDRLAAIISREMGKPLREAKGEIGLVADIYDYYAKQGPGFAADRPIESATGSAVVRSEPLGALLGIMPWNYPYYQVARFAAPNLVLGNTIVLKHAPSCPESAEAMAEIFERVGLPAGVYTNLRATNDQVASMIEMPELQGVSLTGSERAGRAVGELAGRAMKKVVLELGGSDPFIVLPDADLDAAVKTAVAGRMGNSGQACTASKRLIVLDEVYEPFLASLVSRVEAITVGDPSDGDVRMGPLSSEHAVRGVMALVEDAIANGAEVVTGGARLQRDGAFMQPTVLTGVTPAARVYREEIFGPVAVVYRVSSVAEAVELANDSRYGLGAVIFGTEPGQIHDVAAQLEVGMVSVNSGQVTQPELPFGGIKASGIGRELGEYGMAEFVNRKLVRGNW